MTHQPETKEEPNAQIAKMQNLKNKTKQNLMHSKVYLLSLRTVILDNSVKPNILRDGQSNPIVQLQ